MQATLQEATNEVAKEAARPATRSVEKKSSMSSVPRSSFCSDHPPPGRRGTAFDTSAGGASVESLVETYAGVPGGAICALFGSSDHLEIAENGGHAARRLALAAGAAVEVVRPSDAVLG